MHTAPSNKHLAVVELAAIETYIMQERFPLAQMKEAASQEAKKFVADRVKKRNR